MRFEELVGKTIYQTSEEMAKQKGTPTTPGTDSPYRNRSIEENLDLFI